MSSQAANQCLIAAADEEGLAQAVLYEAAGRCFFHSNTNVSSNVCLPQSTAAGTSDHAIAVLLDVAKGCDLPDGSWSRVHCVPPASASSALL